jgi:hypothetical protein
MLQVCAAPHCPAGHFSPYSDGEKDAVVGDFANLQRCRKGTEVAASLFSPSLTGRGCRQRGSANTDGGCSNMSWNYLTTRS